MMFRKFLLAIALVSPCIAQAAAVLDYEGNDRQWGTSNVVNILTVVTNGGHTVTSGSISLIADYNVLLLGEPFTALTGQEISTVNSFVNAGGTLIAITDSGCTGCANLNAILSGVGSAVSLSDTNALASGPLPSVYFTEGPRNIAGQSVLLTPGRKVQGGSPLAGDYGAYETVGSGLVVVFGDRVDWDDPNPTSGDSVNSKLFLNILDNTEAGAIEVTPVPVMGTWSTLLMILMLAGLGVYTVHRHKG